MPTAAEHRAEASSLTAVLDTVGTVRGLLVADRDDVGLRGAASLVVMSAIGAAVADLDGLGRRVELLVDELHRRAALCEQFTLDVQRHDVAVRRWEADVRTFRSDGVPGEWPGPRPVPPRPPFPGAVAG